MIRVMLQFGDGGRSTYGFDRVVIEPGSLVFNDDPEMTLAEAGDGLWEPSDKLQKYIGRTNQRITGVIVR